MGMNDPTLPVCPECGAQLDERAPAGLCPRCLMALNLKTETLLTDPSPPAPPPVPLDEIRPHFPQLEILECLGRGGMGVVYKARQKTLNRLVALKLLAPERALDQQFAERFSREARALAALSHPNIVTIHDFGQAGGFYYLLMEFIDGVNLRDLLRARRLTPEEALAIVPPLCEALQYAHDRAIVHRDIKPENLLLDKQGRVKVADFGIAKILGGSDADGPGSPSGPEPMTRSTLGTPGYSAPEQQADPRRVDRRADIYSLGVVLYEMLTGELPTGQFQPPSRKVLVDVRLDEVVLHALEREPARRYQQASEVKSDVETIVTSARAPAAGPSPASPAAGQEGCGKATKAANPSPKTRERKKMLAIIAGIVLLVIALPPVVTYVTLGALKLQARPGPPAEGAEPPPMALLAARFGPTREATLNDMDPLLGEDALDLERGQVLDLPKDIKQRSGPQQMQWLLEHTADLLVDQAQGRWGLVTSKTNELKLVPLLNQAWETCGESTLTNALAGPAGGLPPDPERLHRVFADNRWQSVRESELPVKPPPPLELKVRGSWRAYLLAPQIQPPLTFAFQTAKGAAGLLQLTEFLKDPSRLKLRYKLLQSSQPPAKFVRLVVTADRLTFEGQPVAWDEVGTRLATVPNRPNTVLEIAVTSDDITVAQQNQWFQQAAVLGQQHGFRYTSFIGIQPPGSRGTGSPGP